MHVQKTYAQDKYAKPILLLIFGVSQQGHKRHTYIKREKGKLGSIVVRYNLSHITARIPKYSGNVN